MEKTDLIKIIDAPLVSDPRGNLIFLEGNKQIPFSIKRIYWMFDLEEDGKRGFHAHRNTVQVLFCTAGKCLIKVDDGKEKSELWLDTPNKGILLDKKVWHSMEKFQEGTTILVLANKEYDESDYLRNYDDFVKYVNCNQ